MQFSMRAGTKPFWCSAFSDQQCVGGSCIFTVSAEEAVQSMAQQVIEETGGAWCGGTIEVRDQTNESPEVRTFFVECDFEDLCNGEMAANVTIEEAKQS